MFTVTLTNSDREVLFMLLNDRLLNPESWLGRELSLSLGRRQMRALYRLRDKLVDHGE